MLPPELGGQDVGHQGNLERGGHDIEEQRREHKVDGAVFFFGGGGGGVLKEWKENQIVC